MVAMGSGPPPDPARVLPMVALARAVCRDGDPGAAAAFVELADYVSGLAEAVEQFRPALVRCLSAIETVAETSEDAEELIVWCLFDNLSPDDVRRLEPWLGPHTRSLLDGADFSLTA